MRSRHKVAAAALAAAAWFGVVAPQAADVTGRFAGSAAGAGLPSASTWQVQAASADSTRQHDPGAAGASNVSDAVAVATPQETAPKATPAASSGRTSAVSAASTNARSSGYDAGGSMAASSPASQVYAQTTQSGWGCQAALQYLSQHANPEFSLVCPGNAMGHQAMTCYYLAGMCPDSAEIVIADPCPAAYENEAWNSWHMGTGPYDPYGWCSDWSGQGGPAAPTPQPPTAGPITPTI